MATPTQKVKFNRIYTTYNPDDTKGPGTNILGTVVQEAEQTEDDDDNDP